MFYPIITHKFSRGIQKFARTALRGVQGHGARARECAQGARGTWPSGVMLMGGSRNEAPMWSV